MENTRIIKVTGRGGIKLTPDVTRITATIEGLRAEYSEATESSSETAERLRGALEQLGFARAQLKTLALGIDAEYEGYQDERGNYRQRFSGYRYRHTMKLEFPCDNALLGRTLYSLAHSGADPELQISYTVSDREAAKNELLSRAVADAKAKAAVLADAAGVALGGIRSIRCSDGEPALEVHPMHKAAFARSEEAADSAFGSYNVDITPDDIEAFGSVTVVWEIL